MFLKFIELLTVAFTIAGAGLVCGIGLSFLASLTYFSLVHSHGTASYFVKTIVIILIAIPFCLLLAVGSICFAMFYVLSRLKYWISQMLKRNTVEEAGELEALSADDVVVHLVHGTFESNAAWTLKGSPMWDEIRRVNPTVKIARFEWTGANTHAARLLAAKKFGGELVNSSCNNHYIVAHSHAGNIIQELSQCVPYAALKIRGVCLLSTPFIYKKVLERTGGQLTLLPSFIGFAMLVEMVAAAVLLPFGLFNGATIATAFLLAFVLDFTLSKRYSAQMTDELRCANDQVDLRSVQIMHAIGDEADSGLRFVSTLHETCFGILSQLAAADKLLRKRINWPYMICYLLHVLAAGAIFWISAEPIPWLISLAVSCVWVAGFHWCGIRHPSKDISSFLIAASLPVAIVAFYLNVMKSIAYGDWRLIFCPKVFIFSSETPPGDHRILKYAPSSDGGLVHSTHSHAGAIRDVACWIWSELEGKPSTE